jgi:hypothetical protein
MLTRLFCSHRVDTVTPIEKTMEALVELKQYVYGPVIYQHEY